MPGAQSLFSNSKNPNFIGCNFNAVNGDYHYHINKNQSGLNTLSKVISVGAIHDSSEHSPKCHPETRKDVLKLILDWIDDPSPPCSVLWLYGPAGAGKTAILQSIAELLNAHQEVPTESIRQCGGSFFFSRGKQGRDEGHQLFPTIGYQLALNLPSLSVHVNKIMESNPILHTKTMDVQLNSLIVDAFHKLKQEGTDFLHTPTVIIDGLDECRGNETQQNILALISQAVVDKKIPLRFLIASRPEAHIRESFDQSNLHTITRRVVLDDSFNPKKDIELFLREGFADISRNHPLKSYTWPGDGIISLLVQKSSGQFIYAATILKFVGSEDSESSSPMKQLNIVLAPNPAAYSNEAFSDLDLLYTQILSACRNPMGVVRVLGVILVLHCYQPPEVIEDILAMEQGEVTLVLRSLHSLIYFPGTKGERYELKEHGSRNSGADGFQLLHESFRDYLVDHRRSGQFFVNIVEAHSKLTVAGFKLMTRWIHYPR
ncbi:hypothetical protein BYT27DRAFT_7224517 [Phlegmacium glaucopus]|nr:hypothetical protein BYT27DRAFT_7224517 [Phlegmacium glaucopus]